MFQTNWSDQKKICSKKSENRFKIRFLIIRNFSFLQVFQYKINISVSKKKKNLIDADRLLLFIVQISKPRSQHKIHVIIKFILKNSFTAFRKIISIIIIQIISVIERVVGDNFSVVVIWLISVVVAVISGDFCCDFFFVATVGVEVVWF